MIEYIGEFKHLRTSPIANLVYDFLIFVSHMCHAFTDLIKLSQLFNTGALVQVAIYVYVVGSMIVNLVIQSMAAIRRRTV